MHALHPYKCRYFYITDAFLENALWYLEAYTFVSIYRIKYVKQDFIHRKQTALYEI